MPNVKGRIQPETDLLGDDEPAAIGRLLSMRGLSPVLSSWAGGSLGPSDRTTPGGSGAG